MAEPRLRAMCLVAAARPSKRPFSTVVVDCGTSSASGNFLDMLSDNQQSGSSCEPQGRSAERWGVAAELGSEQIQRQGLRYEIPAEYAELLKDQLTPRAGEAAPAPDESAEPEIEIEDQRSPKLFWRAARRIARERTKPTGDLTEWEQRVGALRESLWLEELQTTMELSKWKVTVDSISYVSDGLFSLDLSHVSDSLALLLEEEGILRGVQLRIRCNDGRTCWARVQSGSGVGRLLVSAPARLALASGPFAVEFHPLRFQQVAMHRALASPAVESIVLSTAASAAVPEKEARDDLALPASLNDGQRRAVAAALEPGQSHPLVVWGPPGTGKTTLGAFIIWHLVQQQPTLSRILVATPSNTAADLLCAKLARLGIDQGRMLRLNALGRDVATVPGDVLGYSARARGEDGRETFVVPPLDQLRRYKVVVTTCICASHISNAVRNEAAGGWFSHVMVDEAGEATEPETMVPLALLKPTNGRLVLMGDHFQLGPLVLSKLAKQISGLDVSMIERIARERFGVARTKELSSGLERDALLQCEDRGLFFLTESFRSHPDIMRLYSDLIYSGQLEHRPRDLQFGLEAFFKSKGVSGPVVFHNVIGAEEREVGSASIYNSTEAEIVLDYIKGMLAHPSVEIGSQDVGVITPYTRQVRLLQAELGKLGHAYSGVDVGTVEHFQGQERTAIVMSAVRCAGPQDAANPRRPIGFLSDPRRLNVAISRAVAGLVIVGDFRTLALNSKHWRTLVCMAQEAGFMRGEPLDLLIQRPGTSPPSLAETQPQPRMVNAADAMAAWDTLTEA